MNMRISSSAWCGLLLTWVTVATSAQATSFDWPDSQYDPQIPSPEHFLQYGVGEQITAPEDITRYLIALATAAPQQTRLVEYARSWEDRPLHYLVIGSRLNIARLSEIQSEMAMLADPRNVEKQDIDRLTESLPAIIWLAHGVHGNEISSSDAALATAYQLLAGDQAQLDNALVIIDPMQNPDGRNRFVQHYRSNRGIVPQGSSIAAERTEAWPGGRFNHYLFDMNRDWFALTQPEVKGRVTAYLQYFPVVYVDLHEMNTNSTYYFPPPANPHNPFLSERQINGLTDLGRSISAAFDQHGFNYFNREIFDAYYPGYGDTWPTLHGSLGLTFEMASARGLVAHRDDGTTLTYADGIQRHFVASLATVSAAAQNRRKLLRDFVATRSDSNLTKMYIIPRTGDVGRIDNLANTLMLQGIEVDQLASQARLCGSLQPEGSYLVDTRQPAGRLANTLLSDDSHLGESFWREQERRATKKLPLAIYDVIAWSLPFLADIDVTGCKARNIDGLVTEIANTQPNSINPTTAANPTNAKVAYIVPWGSQAATRFLAKGLRQGLVIDSTDRGFRQAGRQFGTGTLILRVAVNDEKLAQLVHDLAASSGAEVIATDQSWVESGVNFGSPYVHRVKPPAIALAWGRPTSPQSAGALRYVIEQRLDYPVTTVRTDSLDSPYLDEFDVLILPHGRNYTDQISESAKQNVARWVKQGGNLIAIGNAVDLLTHNYLDLLATRRERLANQGEAKTKKSNDAEDEQKSNYVDGTQLVAGEKLDQALAPLEEPPPRALGAILNADIDSEHWLANGLPQSIRFVVVGDSVFSPLRRDKGVNVITFAEADRIIAAGHLWEASRLQLAHKPVAMSVPAGRGIVTGFTADPSFRGFMQGLDVLLANAIFGGAAHSSRIERAHH